MCLRPLGVVLFLLWLLPAAASAQATRADSAEALLRAARVLEANGEVTLARRLYQVLAQRFPETTAAREGRAASAGLVAEEEFRGFAEASYVGYHTVFGAFLGVAVPAALGVDDNEPYGVGLLVGAPLGFFGSRAYGRGRALSAGQAGVMSFGSFWGVWQGIGWRAALDIASADICDFDVCYQGDSDTAPWVAAVIGGVAGLGAGILASHARVSAGTSSLIFNASLWGTWYGIAAGVFANAEDDALLTAALIGGNVGLLAAIPGAMAWRPTAARVRTISALGLAGGLAGLGGALLASADTEEAIIGLITGGVTAGLITGVAITKDRASTPDLASRIPPMPAGVLTFRDGWTVGVPLPAPAIIPVASRRGWVPGLRVPVLDASF